jgi:hypothetical protein
MSNPVIPMVQFILYLISMATPNTISKTIRAKLITIAAGMNISKKCPKSVANTSKYSCILISVPIGSFNFTRPEKIKRAPTINLTPLSMYFMVIRLLK